MQQQLVCSGEGKGLGISLLRFSTIQNTKDGPSKAVYHPSERAEPTLLHSAACFPGRPSLLRLLGGPSAKV